MQILIVEGEVQQSQIGKIEYQKRNDYSIGRARIFFGT